MLNQLYLLNKNIHFYIHENIKVSCLRQKNQHKQHIRFKRQVELTLLHPQPLIDDEVVWVHTDEGQVDGDGSGDK